MQLPLLGGTLLDRRHRLGRRQAADAGRWWALLLQHRLSGQPAMPGCNPGADGIEKANVQRALWQRKQAASSVQKQPAGRHVSKHVNGV